MRKKWKIMTNHPCLIEAFAPYTEARDIPDDAYVGCRGRFAKGSAWYPPFLAKVIWSALAPSEQARRLCSIVEPKAFR